LPTPGASSTPHIFPSPWTSLHEAGLAARDIAIAGIQAHLRSGRDLVVAQYLQRHDFIERLDATARECGAAFVETALTIDARVARARFQERAESLAGNDPHGHLLDDMTTIARTRQLPALTSARKALAQRPGSAAVP
jgi:leucyl aminopeptidase (aminopeptidase T)